MTVQATDESWFREPETGSDDLLTRLDREALRAHLAALQSVSAAALAELDLERLLPELLDRLRAAFGADAATVLLREADGEPLRLHAAAGPDARACRGGEVPPGQGISGRVALRGRALIVDDFAEADADDREIPRVASLMAAPLRAEEGVLGVVLVGTRKPRRFTDTDLGLLQLLADRVAPAIRNARRFQGARAEVEARKRTEAELLERQDLHHLLAETAADAIITMDEDSVIVSANPAAAQVFGYPLEELIGRSMVDLIPERFRSAHRAGVLRYLATGRRNIPWRGLELPGLHRSGREILMEVAFAERVREGRRFFTGTMRDITERKATERLLAAQYAVTRVLAEAADIDQAIPRVLESLGETLDWKLAGFWKWESDPQQLRLVDTWIAPEMRGRGLEAMAAIRTLPSGVGLPGRVKAAKRPVWVPDVTKDDNFPRLATAARVGLHGAFAFPVCVGGDCIGVMEFFSPEVMAPDPPLLAAVEALGSDLGQFIRRREAEEQLREREEIQAFLARTSIALAASALSYDGTLHRLAHQAVPTLADWCAVFIRRESGEVVRLALVPADPDNEGLAQDLAEYPVSSGEGSPVVQVIRTGESLLVPEVTEELLKAQAQDEAHLELIRRMGMTSGMVVPLTARGRILGAVVLIAAESGRRFDRADVEVAEEFARRAALAVDNARLFRDAQQANRAKGEFMAVMSHELRTPLNAVIGYADLLKLGLADGTPDTALEYAERIGVAARHLTGLIEEILAFSRLEAGRDPVSVAPVRVEEIVEEIAVIAQPLARERGLGFAVRGPADPVLVVSDAGKIRQILLNLVTNAIKFTREGEVSVDVRGEGDWLVLEVRDTGIGIAPENQERIFDPFWQVEQGTTREAGGTGLGLSVTRKLVDLLNGEIRLSSAPGKGSTFAVYLPASAGAGAPVERAEDRIENPRTQAGS